MKTTTFKADNGTQKVEGVLLITKNKSEIIFDTVVEGFENIEIKEKNIKDVPNFIASIIARFDTKELFNSVKVGRNEIQILRKQDKEETQTVYVQGDGLSKTVLPTNLVKTYDIYGNSTHVFIESEEVIIPKGFKYTKNSTLNNILKANVVPFDYNRAINNTILKIIKGVKKGKISKEKTFYIGKNGDYLLSEKRAVVIFNCDMI